MDGTDADGRRGDPDNAEAISDEYRSLRAESLQAKSNQQSILQWSIGAVGIVAAAVLAALAALGDAKTVGDSRLRLAALAVSLGVVVPTLLASAFAVWIGEVERMERVGRFIRSREETTWEWPPPAITSERAFRELPIFWENLIAAPRLGSTYGKNKTGSLATSLLYVVSFIVSETVGVAALWTAKPAELTHSMLVWRGSVIYGMISISGLILLMLARKLWIIRQRAANHRDARRRLIRMSSMPSVTVVLPCFNEVTALPWVLARMPEGFEPLVVNNNSTDGSGSFAKHQGVRCVEQDVPGTGPTVVTGLANPHLRTIVCIMDCDGTVDPRDLPILIAPIMLDAADAVIGARRGYDARGWIQRAFSRLQAMYISRQLDISVKDLGSAMAVTKRLLNTVNAAGIDSGNAWKIELLQRARNVNARIAEIQIDHSSRIGESKITGRWTGRYATIMDVLRTAGYPVVLRRRRIEVDVANLRIRIIPRHAQIPNK